MIGETNCRLFFDLHTYAVALTNAHENTMGKINVNKILSHHILNLLILIVLVFHLY